MKRIAFPILLIFSILITAFSCSNTPKRSRKPVSTITVQPKKRSYVFGEKVSVNVKTRVKNGEIKSIKLYYNNQLLKESTELKFSIEGVEINTLGNSNFKVETVKTDGIKNGRLKTIKVISDIKTKIYGYKVVNNYPHQKDYYTQGLEYYNGFFYEGTGEYGKSRLEKTVIKTGQALQTYHLTKQYFGEGITILNNKIYQLTWKSKKGFIYNLSDFAVIDSFQIPTKEGWGLTNDGTNLIMSDGTNKLTWLNPSDLSVVKTVQVASSKDILYYLNELEYVNGLIYANIYTTEIIVKIDPETGRVLGEINLAGLIDMYKNSTDKIDYMNGIAYDKRNNRLFVTGKLWPRLFEIEIVEKNEVE
jgi:glutamine cyclotransferase